MSNRPAGGGATAAFHVSALFIAALIAGCAAGEEPMPGAERSSSLASAAQPGGAGDGLIQRVARNSTTGDFDGDGLEDVAYGDRSWGAGTACPAGFGAVVVHYGAEPTRGVRWARGAGLVGPTVCGAELGAAVGAADIDGDGYDDLVVGAPGATQGQIQVAFGAAAGLSRSRQTTIVGPSVDGPAAHFGAAIAAGDFDCDGHADVAVGAPDAGAGSIADAGSVTILPGRPTGIATTGPRLLQDAAGDPPESGDRFGFALAAGNLDAVGPDECGCDDLAISATFEDVAGVQDAGVVHVLFGGQAGPGSDGAETIPTAGPLAPRRGQDTGARLGIGDIDGDGIADLSVALVASGQIAWLAGGRDGLGGAHVGADDLVLEETCGGGTLEGKVTITDIVIRWGPFDCDHCCGPGNCCSGGSCGGD